MTNFDVVDIYKHSKYKFEEVAILAELTATDCETVLEILKDAGEDVSEQEQKYPRCVVCKKIITSPRAKMCESCRAEHEKLRAKYKFLRA